ncbi:MAG: beta-propeller fold lactonase family protein [bacterium]
MLSRIATAGLLASIVACSGGMDRPTPTSPLSADDQPSLIRTAEGGGTVFTQNNATAGNKVLVFGRAADGTLTSAGSYATGGTGTGAGLGSQGAVTLSDDGQYLLAVNAGSNEVTAFRVSGNVLNKLNTVPSGGIMPISVTVHGGVVYVLNGGGTGGIAGFTLGTSGLAAIRDGRRPLSSSAAGPAQISFTPDGSALVVTEKAENAIVTYSVDAIGRAHGPSVTPSAGQTPFGFAFGLRGTLIVSEAFGGAVDASAASSYRTNGASLMLRSASVPDTETAACWFAVTPNGQYAYATNTGSGTVSGYRVTNEGRLVLLDAGGVTGVVGAGSSPTDDAISRNGQFLYVLASSTHLVSAFAINGSGALTAVGVSPALPAGSVGLAAR